jgi:1-acyl-sn-glycerol-3-phosphate acyltransferase
MSSNDNLPDQAPEVPYLYGFFRALVRIWFSLVGRQIRLVRGETFPASGPAILVVQQPPSFSAALALVAASERQLCCLLNVELGFWSRSLAQRLGVIVCEPGREGQKAAFQAAREALANREVVVLFSEQTAATTGDPTASGLNAATLAVDLGMGQTGQLELTIFPVHIFLPMGRSQSGEVLIRMGFPLASRDYLSAGPGKDQARRLASALDEALQQNAFSLMDDELQIFLADLEEVLKVDLEENWATRPHWKQKAAGFTLSQFLTECVEMLNAKSPGHLVALRDRLDAYREAQRRWSLEKAEVEAASSWIEPAGTRLWYWFESVAGLPIAFYGFVNHFLAWVILHWTGLLKKESEGDPMTQWFLRGLVVLGCYAAQIAICAYVLGRATAGYYALTLPPVGAFLWRYRWLVRARTRLLFLAARLPRGAEKARQLRKQLVAEINASRDAYAETVGAIH